MLTDQLSRTTEHLSRRAKEIRERTPSYERLDFEPSPGSYSGVTDVGADSGTRSAPMLTREYPPQGKLTEKPSATVEYADGEPAETLRIAIVVGPEELASGILRNQFTALRGQRHEALVYRWQDTLTYDVIAFDLMGYGPEEPAAPVDLLLLSDQILGPGSARSRTRELEEAALRARLKFPEAYLVGVVPHHGDVLPPTHPFHTVESKARRQSLEVFDTHLMGLVNQAAVSELLVEYARCPRYPESRLVWSVSAEDGIPLPLPKSELGAPPTAPPVADDAGPTR